MPAAPRKRFFGNRAVDGIHAAAEALFPRNELGAPDFEDTALVIRTLEYLALLPAPQRRLIELLFIFVELVLPLSGGRMRRFSRLPVPVRLDLVRRCRASKIYPLRLIGDSIKAVLTVMYMSHPQVLRHIGMFSACAH